MSNVLIQKHRWNKDRGVSESKEIYIYVWERSTECFDEERVVQWVLGLDISW